MKNLKKYLIIIAFVAICLLASSCATMTYEDADTILTGKIKTEDGIVEALAIKDGEVLYAGDLEFVVHYLGTQTKLNTYGENQIVNASVFLAK